MMMILKWVLFALAIMLTAWLIPGIMVESFPTALLAAFVMAIINVFIKPFLLIITLPVNILTLGIFTFILNTLLFMLMGYFVPGVEIDGFWSALLGSLMLAFLGGIIYQVPDSK